MSEYMQAYIGLHISILACTHEFSRSWKEAGASTHFFVWNELLCTFNVRFWPCESLASTRFLGRPHTWFRTRPRLLVTIAIKLNWRSQRNKKNIYSIYSIDAVHQTWMLLRYSWLDCCSQERHGQPSRTPEGQSGLERTVPKTFICSETGIE